MTEVSRRAITSTPVPGSALQIRASARRAFLAGGVAAAALVAGAAGANSAPAVSPDARAVQRCWMGCTEAALLHTRGEVGV